MNVGRVILSINFKNKKVRNALNNTDRNGIFIPYHFDMLDAIQ